MSTTSHLSNFLFAFVKYFQYLLVICCASCVKIKISNFKKKVSVGYLFRLENKSMLTFHSRVMCKAVNQKCNVQCVQMSEDKSNMPGSR